MLHFDGLNLPIYALSHSKTPSRPCSNVSLHTSLTPAMPFHSNSYAILVRLAINPVAVFDLFTTGSPIRLAIFLFGVIPPFHPFRCLCSTLHIFVFVRIRLKKSPRSVVPARIHCRGHHPTSLIQIVFDVKPPRDPISTGNVKCISNVYVTVRVLGLPISRSPLKSEE